MKRANSAPISANTLRFPPATSVLARSNASNGEWIAATTRPSEVSGWNNPLRSSIRLNDASGASSHFFRPSRLSRLSSRSSPRIVLPACRDAQVANVHQSAAPPVRARIAAERSA